MDVQPAAFLRTTLPLDLSRLKELDSGRYHSIWLPDHMVSFWPDSIWTPEFTDLATVSPSPHRHLDALAVAGTAAALTHNTPIATNVVDTVRRHPAMLAQTALTLDHLSKGRFILGLGSGETENTVPYGFDFAKPVSRFEEALTVIRMLWERDGFIDFPALLAILHDNGYSGWLVVEAEQDPAKAHPLTYATMGYKNLKKLATEAGFQVAN